MIQAARSPKADNGRGGSRAAVITSGPGGRCRPQCGLQPEVMTDSTALPAFRTASMNEALHSGGRAPTTGVYSVRTDTLCQKYRWIERSKQGVV